MINKETLKRKIIYRSTYRGTKEMDLLLGKFVAKHIDKFNSRELQDLDNLLFIEDEILYKWYFKNISNNIIPNTKVSKMFKNFKL